MSLRKIGMLLFNDAELLDFAGPLQVFAAFQYLYPEECEMVTTISLDADIKVSKLGMKVASDQSIDNFDGNLDLLVIPGGMGTRPIIKDDNLLFQIDKLCEKAKRVGTVCTGSLIAARLGKLSHLKATTHYAAVDLLKSIDPTIEVDRSKRFHDHDHIIVAEGVSAGIDMSFYLINKFYGAEKADAVRKYIEYYPSK